MVGRKGGSTVLESAHASQGALADLVRVMFGPWTWTGIRGSTRIPSHVVAGGLSVEGKRGCLDEPRVHGWGNDGGA